MIKESKNMQRISVSEAANKLNMTPLTIRVLMQNEKLPIGFVQKRDGCTRAYYIIYKEMVDNYIKGIEQA